MVEAAGVVNDTLRTLFEESSTYEDVFIGRPPRRDARERRARRVQVAVGA